MIHIARGSHLTTLSWTWRYTTTGLSVRSVEKLHPTFNPTRQRTAKLRNLRNNPDLWNNRSTDGQKKFKSGASTGATATPFSRQTRTEIHKEKNDIIIKGWTERRISKMKNGRSKNPFQLLFFIIIGKWWKKGMKNLSIQWPPQTSCVFLLSKNGEFTQSIFEI